MKIKKVEKLPHKIFNERKDFIKLYQKTGHSDIDELQVTNSTYKVGTISRVISESGIK